MSGQAEHQISNFRCGDVVKPLLGPPHPLLSRLEEAVNLIKIVTCLATYIPWPDHVVSNVKGTIFVKHCLLARSKSGQIHEYVYGTHFTVQSIRATS